MTKVYDGSNTVQYKYDLMGRRVAKKKNSGDWKWYFYDGLKVIAEGTTTTNKTFYTNSPAVVGGIITDGTGWFHYDRLGNVVAQTAMDGSPYRLYTMDAFGNVLQTGDGYWGYMPESGGTDAGYHLTTKEFDADAGLYYFNARWYDPTTGRFVSRAGMRVDKEHPYTYAEDSPTGSVDPTGRMVIIPCFRPGGPPPADECAGWATCEPSAVGGPKKWLYPGFRVFHYKCKCRYSAYTVSFDDYTYLPNRSVQHNQCPKGPSGGEKAQQEAIESLEDFLRQMLLDWQQCPFGMLVL